MLESNFQNKDPLFEVGLLLAYLLAKPNTNTHTSYIQDYTVKIKMNASGTKAGIHIIICKYLCG